MRPLDVKLSSPQRQLVAGQTAEFSCLSSGSRPPARLSWFKNGAPLGAAPAEAQTMASSQDVKRRAASVSQSRLSLRLGRADHQARLSCRAEHVAGESANASRPAASPTGWLLEDSITLDVHCKLGAAALTLTLALTPSPEPRASCD